MWLIWVVSAALLLLSAGCAPLEEYLVREFAADGTYQQEVAPYLWKRYEEKMARPDPPSSPAGIAPEDLDRG